MRDARRRLGNVTLPQLLVDYAQGAIEETVRAVEAAGGSVWLLDNRGMVHAVSACGNDQVMTEHSPVIPVEHSFLQHDPWIVEDLMTDPSISGDWREAAEALGTRAFFAQHLKDEDGQVIGGLTVSFGAAVKATEPLTKFMTAMVPRVSQAMHSAADMLQAQKHEEALALVGRIAASIAEKVTMADLIQLISQESHHVVDADVTQVLFVDEKTGDLVTAGDGGRPVTNGEFAVALTAVSSGHAQIVADVELDTRLDPATAAQALLVLPLIAFGQPVGALLVADTVSPRHFTIDDVARMNALADHAATALHQARTFDKLRQREAELETLSNRLMVANEEERRRLGRRLDQRVAGKLLDVEAAMGQVHMEIATRGEFSNAHRLCGSARKIVQDTAQTARTLSLELHPGILDDLGLVPALRWYCSEIQKKSGLEIRLTAPARVDAEPEVARALYRAAQECLQNVAQHAAARSAVVSLIQTNDTLSIRVEDDGSGFDYGAVSTETPDGIGLLRLRERADHLGGKLRVASAVDGTTIEMSIPTSSPA